MNLLICCFWGHCLDDFWQIYSLKACVPRITMTCLFDQCGRTDTLSSLFNRHIRTTHMGSVFEIGLDEFLIPDSSDGINPSLEPCEFDHLFHPNAVGATQISWCFWSLHIYPVSWQIKKHQRAGKSVVCLRRLLVLYGLSMYEFLFWFPLIFLLLVTTGTFQKLAKANWILNI